MYNKAIAIRTELLVQALFANKFDPITCATAVEFGRFPQSSSSSLIITRRILVLEGHIPQASIEIWTQTCLLANPTLLMVQHHDWQMLLLDQVCDCFWRLYLLTRRYIYIYIYMCVCVLQDTCIVIMLVVRASEYVVEVDTCVATTAVNSFEQSIQQAENFVAEAFGLTLPGVEWMVFWRKASASATRIDPTVLEHRLPVSSLDERFDYFLSNEQFPWRKFLPYLAANLRGALVICWDEEKTDLLIGTSPVCAALVSSASPPRVDIVLRPLPLKDEDLDKIRLLQSALLDCLAGFSLEMCAAALQDRFSQFAPLLEGGSGGVGAGFSET